MTTPISKQENRTRIVWALISAPTVLVALLYLMGRQYIKSYYSAAGVQPSFLRFQTADYLYFGANWVTLVFAFFYVVLAYHIGRYVFYDYTADQATQESKEPVLKQILFFFSTDKWLFWVMVFALGANAYTVLRLAMHELSQQTTDYNSAIGEWLIFLLIGLLGTVFLRDTITVSFLKRSSLLRTLVLGILAVLVFMMPYVGVAG